jgi:hypothetical protein
MKLPAAELQGIRLIKIAGSPIKTSHTKRFKTWKMITCFALNGNLTTLVFDKC